MRTLRFLSFLSFICVISLSAMGAYTFATKGLWITAMVCAGCFIALCLYLYRIQDRPLKAFYSFISRKCNGGQKELPHFDMVSSATMHDIDKIFEELLSAHNRQLFDEATRLKQYELLLEHVDTGVLLCTPEGKILWKNPAAEHLIGPCGHIPEEWFGYISAHAGVIPINRHGIPRDILFSVTRFTQKHQTHMLFTLKDIRNILEEQQIESWKTLARVLTHEIMNSIAPILSLSEILATRTYEEPDAKSFQQMQQAMQVIHRRSKGLLDFVENYRKLTRLPAPQYSEVRADELFNDLQKLFNRPDITFEQPYPEFTFQADRGQIEQVLINLIKNAVEASSTSEKGIQVRLLRDVLEDEVIINVQDHGQGISADVQKRLFVPFFTTKPSGSGIGLNLCKQIANAHHGHISVHSVEGKGSCFSLSLPRKAKPEKPRTIVVEPDNGKMQA